MKALCILFDKFEELEAMGPITLLARAGIKTDIYSIKNEAYGKHDVCISNLKSLNNLDCTNYDILFIPGGPHYSIVEGNEIAINTIKYFYNNKKPIACICAAPTILGRLGMLKGRKYTCFKPMNDDFGGQFIDTYVVQDDFILTGISAAASIDLGFLMIKYLLGEKMEKTVKESIFY